MMSQEISIETKPATDHEVSGLGSAPAHIQLAVDLIYLLESHELDKQTVLQALEIVKQDFLNKA